MDFISGLALVLLTLVGYSSGAVLGAKSRTAVPSFVDLLVIVVLWIGALATRDAVGKLIAFGIWMVVGLFLGAALARVRASNYPKGQPLIAESSIWNAWKSFTRKMGNYQSRVLISFLYFSIVLPFGLGLTLLAHPLRVKRALGNSNWLLKQSPLKPSIDEARRQF